MAPAAAVSGAWLLRAAVALVMVLAVAADSVDMVFLKSAVAKGAGASVLQYATASDSIILDVTVV
jgi:hypothetical protein